MYVCLRYFLQHLRLHHEGKLDQGTVPSMSFPCRSAGLGSKFSPSNKLTTNLQVCPEKNKTTLPPPPTLTCTILISAKVTSSVFLQWLITHTHCTCIQVSTYEISFFLLWSQILICLTNGSKQNCHSTYPLILHVCTYVQPVQIYSAITLLSDPYRLLHVVKELLVWRPQNLAHLVPLVYVWTPGQSRNKQTNKLTKQHNYNNRRVQQLKQRELVN